MVSHSALKRHTPSTDAGREFDPMVGTHTPIPLSTVSFLSTPTCLTSTPRPKIATVVNAHDLDALIERYLANSQFKNAVFWADKRLALSRENGAAPSFVDIAHFIRVIVAVGDWSRLIAYVERHELIMKHVFFAYYFVAALAKKKMFIEILRLKLNDLPGFDDPASSQDQGVTHLLKVKSKMPSEEEHNELNKICDELKLEAGLLLILGRTYLLTQNRRAAQLCLVSAIEKDPTNVDAFDLLAKYKLIPSEQFEELHSKNSNISNVMNLLHCYYVIGAGKTPPPELEETVKALESDLSVRTSIASQYYHFGHAGPAYTITSKILDEAGMFQDCLLVYVATLVQLRKTSELFMLAHQLVDSQPDNELSWYAVGCYYYSVGQLVAAKSFFNKCTSMNCSFGEGWLAFGHVLTAESEHEQAMNCYLRASRVLEGSFEPLMYIGLQYTYANNTKLAQDFLRDALEIADNNPLVLHEQGCIHYMKKEYKSAETCFTSALKIVLRLPTDTEDVTLFLHHPISEFWEPLINNLGHVKRKLQSYEEAVKFHQKSLLICPRKSRAICAIGMNLASMGSIGSAMEYFHEALSVSAHDTICKQALEKVAEFTGLSGFLSLRNQPAPPITIEDFELDKPQKDLQNRVSEKLKRAKKKSDENDRKLRIADRSKICSTSRFTEDVEMD